MKNRTICALNMSLFLQDKLLVRGTLHADSIVILTSRSTALLRSYCDHVHEVNLLSTMLAEQLFAGYAFGAEEPCEAIQKRAAAVVGSCGGLPLAIEVSINSTLAADAFTCHMPSFLVNNPLRSIRSIVSQVMGSHLRGKVDLEVWDESLAKLANAERMGLDDRLFTTLRISYDALDRSERRMFLDAATVFLGRRADMALRAWRACVPQEILNL